MSGEQEADAAMAEKNQSPVSRLIRVARHIEDNADERLTLAALGEIAGLSPSRLQRVFKEAFGISPRAYQDAVRMGRFKHSLKVGKSVTDAIYSSGYGSVSRVYGEATRSMGMPPKTYRKGGAGEMITYACRDTAFGLLAMAATEKGVCFAQFGDDQASLVDALQTEFPNAQLKSSPARDTAELDTWIDAMNRHLSEGAPRPELPVDMRGTAFQMKVWQFLTRTREGDRLSYSELADAIDNPRAVRAVASACARNRIGVLVPCHRVLRGDGSLGGYRWGLERKRALLELERTRTMAP